MECPMQDCEESGTLREIERHRVREHDCPKWDTPFELPPGNPDAELPS